MFSVCMCAVIDPSILPALLNRITQNASIALCVHTEGKPEMRVIHCGATDALGTTAISGRGVANGPIATVTCLTRPGGKQDRQLLPKGYFMRLISTWASAASRLSEVRISL